MSTPNELYTIAAHYLKVMTSAVSESARLHKAGDLSLALESVTAWLRRYRKATDVERSSVAMFNDWYENVVRPSDVYSEWLWQVTTPEAER